MLPYSYRNYTTGICPACATHIICIWWYYLIWECGFQPDAVWHLEKILREVPVIFNVGHQTLTLLDVNNWKVKSTPSDWLNAFYHLQLLPAEGP